MKVTLRLPKKSIMPACVFSYCYCRHESRSDLKMEVNWHMIETNQKVMIVTLVSRSRVTKKKQHAVILLSPPNTVISSSPNDG